MEREELLPKVGERHPFGSAEEVAFAMVQNRIALRLLHGPVLNDGFQVLLIRDGKVGLPDSPARSVPELDSQLPSSDPQMYGTNRLV